ncbi:hypothetical protein J2Y89_001282 [Curtobacterium herbarum]|nr:hypothetical protein [Curtobacterium herbarum]
MHEHRKRPHLLRADTPDRSVARALQRGHRSGELVLLRAGVFIRRSEWEALDEPGRHLARARAVAPDLEPSSAFSHVTAAVAHGWPVIGSLPERVHVTDDLRPRTAHRAGLVRHAGPVPELDPIRLDGVGVTAPLPTALSLIRSVPVHVAAVALDAGLRDGGFDVDDLVASLPTAGERGSARGPIVVGALDCRHESVGESFTAIRLVELGAPTVVPQHKFAGSGGRADRVDFWLPDVGVVIEFDGKQKYVDPTMIGTSDPAEVLWREKVREDRLRRQPEVRTVVRVTWWHLIELDRFRALLRAHGVRF